jgi:hypothetical protein
VPGDDTRPGPPSGRPAGTSREGRRCPRSGSFSSAARIVRDAQAPSSVKDPIAPLPAPSTTRSSPSSNPGPSASRPAAPWAGARPSWSPRDHRRRRREVAQAARPGPHPLLSVQRPRLSPATREGSPERIMRLRSSWTNLLGRPQFAARNRHDSENPFARKGVYGRRVASLSNDDWVGITAASRRIPVVVKLPNSS